MAISRKGNVGNEHAPAYPPAVARRREIPCNRNDDTRTRITDQANTLNALSLWARRGGTKCRKNSPQVTVFSQSGEVAMLRAGQALATWQSPGRENLLAYTTTQKYPPAVALHPNTRPRWLFTQILARGGSPSEYLPARSPCLASGASLPHADSDLNIGGIFYPPVLRFYLTDRKNGGIIRI